MKKWLQILGLSFVLMLGLAACGQTTEEDAGSSAENTEQSAEQSEESVQVVISKNKGEETLTDKTIEIEEGQTVYDVMANHFDIEDNNGFITSIDGVVAKEEEKQAWMYSVNDESAEVGAKDYELKAGDKVTFDLQKWE
ncbi:DUF4430 domain-containing protein [Pontibacillus litoralis]|uniref:Transcobalamin-like C-terminal domain-containing protein n=1 Tax=Pontibacillus litoralis JSM 072002 TaxID=1385512 RepID=A0A0A5G496_9BACI|nr:DUF4430 domain-containing protein [Pontibacillus litoralis]KGX85953.1 hypothetical protein N784_06165 [Pontibacillus litoralis JSM 072002]